MGPWPFGKGVVNLGAGELKTTEDKNEFLNELSARSDAAQKKIIQEKYQDNWLYKVISFFK